MSNAQAGIAQPRNKRSNAPMIDMKLEVDVIPNADVDRSKKFYGIAANDPVDAG